MELEQVKAVIQRVLADGVLNQTEMDEIEAAIHADGVVSAEEAALLDTIYAKLESGEVQLALDPRPDPADQATST